MTIIDNLQYQNKMFQLENLCGVDPIWSDSLSGGGIWYHHSGDVCVGKVMPGEIGKVMPILLDTSDAYDECLVYSGDVFLKVMPGKIDFTPPILLDTSDAYDECLVYSGDASGRRRGTYVVIGAIRFDWKETRVCHVLKGDLPGFKKEEVKVEVKGEIMEIRGKKGREKKGNNDKYHLMERGGGKFIRRFKIPEGAKLDEVYAAMEDGVLTVTIPKEDLKSIDIFLGKRKID